MTAFPRAVFGMPAYNHAHKLREALDSILLQTRQDFCLIVSDDNSTDDTRRVVEEYAVRDERIIYHRAERRLGYIGNARHCFELGRQLYPQAEFFAWTSDHDLWHPRWLELLERALDDHPDAVIACPLVQRIDAEGSVVWTQSPAKQCSTIGEPPSARRFSKAFNTMAAGNMVYGLMRAEAVEKAGGLPWHLLPDRLLLAILSLYGTMVSVPEYLWYRRYRGLASVERQIKSSFLSSPPGYLRFPWWIAHSGHLLNYFVLTPAPDRPLSRWKGVGYSALYLLLGVKHVIARKMVALLYPVRSVLRRLEAILRRQRRRLNSIRRPLNLIRRRVNWIRRRLASIFRRRLHRLESILRRLEAMPRRLARFVLRRISPHSEQAPARDSGTQSQD